MRRRFARPAPTLVQLWSGMIYAGPGLIGETVRA